MFCLLPIKGEEMKTNTVIVGWHDRNAKDIVFSLVIKVEKRGSQYEKLLILTHENGGTTTITLSEVAYYSVLPNIAGTVLP